MNLGNFDAPFAADDIEWRINKTEKREMVKSGQWCSRPGQQGNHGSALMMYAARHGWRNEYRDIPNNGGVECGISIKIDSEWR